MPDDVYIEEINISGMQRNAKKLQTLAMAQGKTIALLQKDLRLCFERIDDLKQSLSTKQDDIVGTLLSGLGKKGKR